MPTILMSRTERGAASPATPGSRHRSPGRAVSMSRIDMLSVPRQHGKHVTSVSVSPSKAGLSPHVIININSDPHVLLSSCPLLNQYLCDDVRCDLSLCRACLTWPSPPVITRPGDPPVLTPDRGPDPGLWSSLNSRILKVSFLFLIF